MPSQRELDRRSVFNRRLCRRIRARRKELKIKQGELAKAMCLSRPSIVLMEQGRRTVHTHELMRLCRLLKWRMSDLLPNDLFVAADYIKK